MADQESGAKWWVRYVIVAILAGGSGVVALGSGVVAIWKNIKSALVNPNPQPILREKKISTVSPNPVPPLPPKIKPETSGPTESKSLPIEEVKIWLSKHIDSSDLRIDGRGLDPKSIKESQTDFITLRLASGGHTVSAACAQGPHSMYFSLPQQSEVDFDCEIPYGRPPVEQ